MKLDLFLSHSLLHDAKLNYRFIKLLLNIDDDRIFESNTAKAS